MESDCFVAAILPQSATKNLYSIVIRVGFQWPTYSYQKIIAHLHTHMYICNINVSIQYAYL